MFLEHLICGPRELHLFILKNIKWNWYDTGFWFVSEKGQPWPALASNWNIFSSPKSGQISEFEVDKSGISRTYSPNWMALVHFSETCIIVVAMSKITCVQKIDFIPAMGHQIRFYKH